MTASVVAGRTLRVNDTFVGVNSTYTVLKKLGEGGFGAVYLVADTAGQRRRYALKTEAIQARMAVLRMEVDVLDRASRTGARHFCALIDRGKNEHYCAVVMTLIGVSLHDMRKSIRLDPQKFSLSTAVRSAGIQCLESIEELHQLGFLHRDIKPGNFSAGRADNNELHRIYIFDFGMARRYRKESDGAHRTPREVANFRGTPRYASLRCHERKELSRRDDIESWFYHLLECTTGAIPWRQATQLDHMHKWKVSVRHSQAARRDMLALCPPEYNAILLHIDSLEYYSEPNYVQMYRLLQEACRRHNYNETQPYDWEHPRFPHNMTGSNERTA